MKYSGYIRTHKEGYRLPKHNVWRLTNEGKVAVINFVPVSKLPGGYFDNESASMTRIWLTINDLVAYFESILPELDLPLLEGEITYEDENNPKNKGKFVVKDGKYSIQAL